MRRPLFNVFALGLFVAVSWSNPAAAQQVDEASRATARTLGREGIEAFHNKDFPVASEKLERAFRVVKLPSVALWSARSLEKSGKLVEAAERYLEATRLPTNAGDRGTQEQARVDAAKERELLLPRIPTLKIEVGTGVEEVRIDGTPVPVELLGVPRPVNPGSHTVTASRGSSQKSEPVSIKESDQQLLKLEIAEADGAETAKAGDQGDPNQDQQKRMRRDQQAPDKGRAQRIAGWSALGLGGAGVVVGSIAGILVMSKHNSSAVKDGCNDAGQCPPSLQPTVDSYNNFRTISTVAFIVGGVGIGSGLGLLFTAPKKQQQAASITPWVGIGSAGVNGAF